MLHSRLLKFILPLNTSKMAETTKIYDNQESNVEAEVPGAHKMREPESDKSSKDSALKENVSKEDFEMVPSDDFSAEPVIVVTKTEATFTKGDLKLQKVTVTEDISMKYQHLFKKETLPGKTVEGQSKMEVDSLLSDAVDGGTAAKRNQVVTGERNGLAEEKPEDKRSKTKIPVSRFRQTVEKVKAERRGSKDKKEHESHIPVRRSSIPKPVKDQKQPTAKKETPIPKVETESPKLEDEFDKIYAEIVDTTAEVNIDDSILNTNVEDPEKLESTFEEIIHDYDEHKIEPVNLEVVRRSKIPFLKRNSQQKIELGAQAERTSKIIAARDKLRLRHSLSQNEDFEKELDKELLNAENVFTPNNTPEVNELFEPKLNPTEPKMEKHETIPSPNSRTDIEKEITKTVSTFEATVNTQPSSVVETITVKEISTDIKDKRENKHVQMEENITKDSIKTGIPTMDSHVHELSENSETTKSVEVRKILSCKSVNEDISVAKDSNKIYGRINSETFDNHFVRDLNVSFTEHYSEIDRPQLEKPTPKTIKITSGNNSSEVNDEEKIKSSEYDEVEFRTRKGRSDIIAENTNNRDKSLNQEDVQLKGKVGRIISKIDSKEIIETDTNKRESINELTKKKSVLSKIAMFERTEGELAKTRTHQQESKLPKLKLVKDINVEHTHLHTPLIVHEVFKPFHRNEDNKNDENNVEGPMKKENVNTSERPELSLGTTTNSRHSRVEDKVQIGSPPTKIKTTENNITHEINEAHTPIQLEIDSDYTLQKAETATTTDASNEINNLKTETIDVNDPKYASTSIRVDNKILNESKFDNTNIGEDRVSKLDTKPETNVSATPGYRTVSELLRNFESKAPKRSIIRRHVNREFSTKELDTSVHKATFEFNENSEATDNFDSINDFRSLDDVFTSDKDVIRREDDMKRAKSVAGLDLGDAVKGKVTNLVTRITSVERNQQNRRSSISLKEMPRKRSVSEKIALFEGKLTPARGDSPALSIYNSTEKPAEVSTTENKTEDANTKYSVSRYIIEKDNTTEGKEQKNDEERIKKTIEELKSAKTTYGKIEKMPTVEFSNGVVMPVLAVGTAMMDPRLVFHVIGAAIDMGYRAIDSAYIYGNEREVGAAVKAKIEDGTVKREELFIISKLWSTFHQTDLVEGACKASLEAMGLDYFDLYLIHNPMSFKEGGGPIPKISTVLQYSEHDYLDAWYGMETLVQKRLARAIGVSNFNSVQLQRVLDKGRVKPVVDQVECHPYLSQQRLDNFCAERQVALSCFGVLGSKGTPIEYKSGAAAAIDDPLVIVMASGLGITPAQMLIRYQLENSRSVVVKASSAAHLWDNLQALNVRLTSVEVDALNALNRNRRTFTFKGMGDTHRNYPFNITF